MIINYEKLVRLLRVFGVELKIDGDSVTFTDLKTDEQVKPFIISKRGFSDSEREDVSYLPQECLFREMPIYLEGNQKFVKMRIVFNGRDFNVREITNGEIIDGVHSQAYKLEPASINGKSFKIEELEFDGVYENLVRNIYYARETSPRKYDIDIDCYCGRGVANLSFNTDPVTNNGYPLDDVETLNKSGIELNETIETIQEAELFKESLKVLLPDLYNAYKQIEDDYIEEQQYTNSRGY